MTDLTLPPGVPDGVVAFDLETQKSFDDVGGREHINQLRMSVGVLYRPKDDAFEVYREHQVHALVDRLFGAPLVVGFNVVGFDFKVLSAYVKRDWKIVRCADLMQSVEQSLGRRIKLDNLAEATLGAGKTGNGLDAIRWFREGNWETLTQYCQADVKITWDLFVAAKRDGRLSYTNRGEKTSFPVGV